MTGDSILDQNVFPDERLFWKMITFELIRDPLNVWDGVDVVLADHVSSDNQLTNAKKRKCVLFVVYTGAEKYTDVRVP